MKLLVSEDMQYSLDSHIDWTIERFGEGYLSLKKMITPHDFFFDGYENDRKRFLIIARRVSMIMDVPFDDIEFVITSNNTNQKVLDKMISPGVKWKGNAGLYQDDHYGKPTVFIDDSNLDNPIMLVAVLAHELAHYKLLYQLQTDADNEYLTDLLTVFFGFCAFNPNVAVDYRKREEIGKYGWSIGKTGYLNEYEFGYVVAKWVLLFDLEVRALKEYLKPNVYDSYKRTLKYLNKWPKFSIKDIIRRKYA